ncbi:MAG: subtilisin family serine protease [Chlamydiales bacterium]|jgi:subtilisin family serine protease
MSSLAAPLAVITATVLAGSALAAPRAATGSPSGPQVEGVRWRSGVSSAPLRSRARVDASLSELVASAQSSRSALVHFVVQFDRPLAGFEQQDARAAGLNLLNYLGNDAYFASSRAQTLELGSLAGLPLVDARAIQRDWKLHPMLARGEFPDWSVVDGSLESGAKGASQAQVAVYVMFHPDVSLMGEAVEVVRAHGGIVRDVVESIHTFVVELPRSAFEALADEDIVQYIEPPLPRLGMVNDSNRARVGADMATSAPYNLDGTGVSVLVYDGGTARATHQDFGGRASARDGSGMHYHSTHVAGTIGGDGSASGGQYTGMAPGTTIESYGFEYDGSNIFLYTNPGDFEADYGDAINMHGATLANNSIGTNTESNGFPCVIQGDYGLMSSLIDAVARGSVSGGEPFRIVWAAGNERQGSSCDIEGYGDYYSTAPPATAKNHITVGALNSNDDSVTSFTSWGPTDDGRLKPDVSGPGCQSDGDFGVTSADSDSDSAYRALCGTSMAAPTVAGVSALIIQDYRAQFGGPDPLPSTLKVFLAHTAEDVENLGPDYKTGYGSVRAVPAIDFLRTGNFVEKPMDQGGLALFAVSVMGGEDLRVTLAWDDFPATPNVAGALVNDLDLHLFSPSGVEAFPWTLDPLSPGTPAVRNQHDHLNNIEQVFVAGAESGVWRIEVRGTTVPQGPQDFSLAASPLLINCTDDGFAAFDGSAYSCSDSVGITVVDCGLNTDDGVIETVDVTVTSTSEPGGEVVTLTESGPETAAFFGNVATGTVDAPGIVKVAHGDTLEALYVDADDGSGGMGVSVTAMSGVDCVAPLLTSVMVTNLMAQDATVDILIDEAASVTLRYGLNCGALNQEVATAARLASHSLSVVGLAVGTTYFFDLVLTDAAGNVTVDDNFGACYSFITTDVPDYFTEQFGTNDLDLTTIDFARRPTADFYRPCTRAASSFPTNPSGGTSIFLSDDDSKLIVLAGGAMVSLYGVSYDRFYVGSNGYITFGSGDTTYSESLGSHFGLPRISANFDDYNPSGGGTVSWKQLGNRAVVTWQNVPEYGSSNQNSFQIEMFFNGRIRVTYQDMASLDGVAGLSAGNGIPDPFIPSDLSEYRCLVRTRTPQ